MYVYQQSRQVVDSHVVAQPVHDRLHFDAVDERAVAVEVHPEVLDLYDPGRLWEVTFSLKVREAHEVVVQHSHLSLTHGHSELRVGGVAIYTTGEDSTLTSVEHAHALV